MQLFGLALAAVIGISLGLLGGGGSILAVPILVYVVGMQTKTAIAVSLLVVGTSSLIGALRHWRANNVHVRTAVVFGVISMAGSFAGGRAAAFLPDSFQLTLFAVVMLAASVSMFRSRGDDAAPAAVPRLALVVTAAVVGLLTGVVGVGGGFLIVPALVLFSGVSMKRAVGTSLLVIAMNSASGFLAYAGHVQIDWSYTILFTSIAIAGVFAGSALLPKVSQNVLKRSFAAFLVVLAGFILAQNAGSPESRADQVRKPQRAAARR